jgi:hypothetical protein
MWAVGLTLAGTVLAGLVLNVAGGLIRLSWTITFTVAVVTVTGLTCAGVARSAGKRGVRRESRPSGVHRSPLTGGFLLLAALLAGGAVWLAAVSANWQRSPGFAQLWLVPTKGASVTLGVRDNYPGSQALRLTLRGGKTVATWDLKLGEGETWQRTVNVTAPHPPLPGGKLTATLTTPDRVLSVTS